MKYENINPIYSKEEVLRILNESTSSKDKVHALLGAVEGIDDSTWLENIYLKYVNDNDHWVANAAILGIGYTARIFKKLDTAIVITRLLTLMKLRQDLSGVINDALDEIEVYMEIKIER